MTELRKDRTPPTDEDGNRIISRDVRINANTFHTNRPEPFPGESVPVRNGVSLRIEEVESHRIVFQFDMSAMQWLKLQSSLLGGGSSLSDSPRAELRHVPSSCVLGPEFTAPDKPEYHRLADDAREALNKALHQYEDAVDDLEALHSEKAGRAAMAEGIRSCRTAISQSASSVQYAYRVLNEHIDACLQTMLQDDRFTEAARSDAQAPAGATPEADGPPEPSETPQGATGRLTDEEFTNLMTYVMATDPDPRDHVVTSGIDSSVRVFLDAEAAVRGFDSWYAAYCEMDTP